MRYPIPGTDSWFIDKDMRFWKDDLECDPGVQNEMVKIKMYGIDRILDINWLLNVAIFGVVLPTHLVHKLFTHIGFVKCVNWKRSWPYTTVFSSPIYLDDAKKFRIIPNYTRCAISRDGVILRIADNLILNIIKSGYCYSSLYDGRIMRATPTGVHRLLCLAWLANDFPETKFYINHIDGNKFNNVLSNLEWVTPSENIIHAFDNGLRTDNSPHTVRDITTGEITEHFSLSVANDYMREVANVSSVNNTANSIKSEKPVRISKLAYDRFEIRREGDTRPWYYEKHNLTSPVVAGRFLIDVTYPNGETKRFHGNKEFAKVFKLSPAQSSGMPAIMKLVRSRHPDHVFVVTDQYDTRPVQVLRIADGCITEYPFIAECGRALNIQKEYVRLAAVSNGRKVINGYLFRRKSDDPWPTEYTSFERITFRTKVINKSTNEEVVFNSVIDAQKALGITTKTINRMVIRPKHYDQYLVSYLNKD